MGKGIKAILRKLDRRLMFFICLTVIPVNVLAILLSHVVVREAQERVAVTYETEFEIFMGRKLGQIEIMEQWYTNLVAQNQRSFMASEGLNEVKSIVLANEAGDALNLYGLRGFFYLKENTGDGKSYMSASASLYSPEEIQQMKGELEALAKTIADGKDWEIIKLGNHYFFLTFYVYRNYEVGFAMDIGEELEEWLQSEYMEDCGVILSDSMTRILCQPEGLQEITETDALAYREGEYRDWELSGEVQSDSTNIWAEFYYNGRLSSAPVLYVVLQCMAWFAIGVLVLLWFLIRRQAVRPLKVLEYGMRQLDKQQWDYRIIENAVTEEYDYVYREFNRMAEDIRKAREQEKLLYETQLNNLKLQVNPHLLLNSLNMVYSLAETRQYQVIQKFTMNLVEYFRYCLRENSNLVTLKSEMRFVENYLEIQKIRYPGELSGVYSMEDSLKDALIPPLIVQNFVENAVKYARKAGEAIEILIYIRREGERLFISINDTGAGIEEGLVKYLNEGVEYEDKDGRKHIGVYNCRKRLELFYGDRASLKINSTIGEGTQVWMELPYLTNPTMSDLC